MSICAYYHSFPLYTLTLIYINIHEYGLRRGQESPYYRAHAVQVHLSTAQVCGKSVVIPCAYIDFHGITTDLHGLLQCVYGVCTVQIWTLLIPLKSVFIGYFPL